jgi:hypothetical protein
MYRHIFLLLLFASNMASAEEVYVETDGSMATVWNTAAIRNCGFQAMMQIEQDGNHFTLTEVDTGQVAFCICFFDLSATIGPLSPGDYTVAVFSLCQYEPLTFRGSAEFEIIGPGLLGVSNSGCLRDSDRQSLRDSDRQNQRDPNRQNLRDPNRQSLRDSDRQSLRDFAQQNLPDQSTRTSLDLEVDGENLSIYWDPILNCCLLCSWTFCLESDTLHVEMEDVGEPCDCICPFELSVTFGPFESGSYVLDFRPWEFGFRNFEIDGPVPREGREILGQFQSDCYNAVVDHQIDVIEYQGQTLFLSWEELPNAMEYFVYSSSRPYGGFEKDESGVFSGTSWTAPAPLENSFYRLGAEVFPIE